MIKLQNYNVNSYQRNQAYNYKTEFQSSIPQINLLKCSFQHDFRKYIIKRISHWAFSKLPVVQNCQMLYTLLM